MNARGKESVTKGVRLMANEQNLVSLKKRSQRERNEIAKKGAAASNAKQKARKTLREELIALLSEGNTQNRMSLALIEKAMNGDTKAFEVIRDSIGEKQTEKVETSGEQNVNVNIKVINDGH